MSNGNGTPAPDGGASLSPGNPFSDSGLARAAQPPNATVMADQARSIAEVQAAMIIAKRFPRDPVHAVDRILAACARPTLAEQGLYSYNRGGSDVTGPSIRLAEAIAQNWGNLQFGIRELEQRNGESTVEAFAWDVETNTRQVKVFQVPHVRHTRKGSYKLEDPRDVYEMVANQGARRLRACILGVVPGDVIEAAVRQCETTLTTKAEVTPERVKNLLEKFAAFSVTKEQIEARIQRRLDAMTPALMVQLGKVYNSLRDGMSSPADWFEPPAPPEGQVKEAAGNEGLKAALKGRREKPAPKAEPKAEPAPEKPHRPPSNCNRCGHGAPSHFTAEGEPRNCVIFECDCGGFVPPGPADDDIAPGPEPWDLAP